MQWPTKEVIASTSVSEALARYLPPDSTGKGDKGGNRPRLWWVPACAERAASSDSVRRLGKVETCQQVLAAPTFQSVLSSPNDVDLQHSHLPHRGTTPAPSSAGRPLPQKRLGGTGLRLLFASQGRCRQDARCHDSRVVAGASPQPRFGTRISFSLGTRVALFGGAFPSVLGFGSVARLGRVGKLPVRVVPGST